MISRALLPLALSAVGTSATMLPREAAAESAGFIRFPISHRQAASPGLRRRGNDVTLYNLTNTAYMMNLEIGTPGQTITMQIDTGSSDFWVNPNCTSNDDTSSVEYCESMTAYDASSSSTSKELNSTDSLAYGIGNADIEFYSDVVTIPGTNDTKLTDVQFGVALASQDLSTPILGVGYGYGYNTDYMNLIDQLVSQGAIASHAFSLVLGTDTDSSDNDDVGDDIANGAIIFGGVDTKKFTGTLQGLDVQPPEVSGNESMWRYWVNLKSVGYTKSGSSSSDTYADSNATVLLDSGSSLSYLPMTVVQSIADSLGVQAITSNSTDSTDSTAADDSDDSDDSEDSSVVVLDCDAGDNGGTIDFTFDSITINVPLTALMWKAQGICMLGITGSDSTSLLGDTFLRSVYALYDQEHNKIYLAEAANCGTNTQSITNSSSYSFTGECSTSTSTSSSPSSTSTAKSASAALYPLSLTALLAFVGLQSLMMML